MSHYQDRQNWDLSAWPEMYAKLRGISVLQPVPPRAPSISRITPRSERTSATSKRARC